MQENNRDVEKKNGRNNKRMPAVTIFSGRLIQFVSYRMATRFALGLFTRAVRRKPTTADKHMYDKSDKSLEYIPAIKKKIKVYRYGVSSKRILLLHGWSGWGTQLSEIADALKENGYMVFSFDAPAHGFSEGKHCSIEDLVAAIKFMNDKYGPFYAAIGHSFGGLTLLNSVKEKGFKLTKLILIGTPDTIVEIIAKFVKRMGLKPVIAQRMRRYFETKFNRQVHTYDGSFVARSINNPVLILHDTDDLEVGIHCAHAINKNLKNSKLVISRELGHKRILKDKNTIATLVEWLSE